jgi:signal transduction histidine kinase/ActR/RegA family two-component response regulator
MKRSAEGIGRYTSLNGDTVFTSWTPSRHGWSVAFATPSAPVYSAFRNYLTVFGALWLLAVGAGIGFAVFKGRRIAGALESLEARAVHLGAGRPLTGLEASQVKEVDHALAALGQASAALEAATQQRNAALEVEREAREAAEAGSRAKDEFLAMLGHELRNPLAAITNAAAIVKSRRSTPEQVEFAGNVVERQSQHLKRLIDDLLDVGRVMTGKILLEREPLDLADSARHVASTLETAGRLAQRHLAVEAQPAWVSGDPTRIDQIVTNLLVNAATYTAPGGRIRLRVAREGGHALLEVSDDGRGIEPETLSRVFELFFQGNATVDRSRGGLGIGLTLVQRLVELHGGSVHAYSAGLGRGAVFTVRLPGAAAPATTQRPTALAELASPREILIVEDNADERRSLRMALELQGHRVLEAADGAAALVLLREHAPQVAILDIGLPDGIDGYRLAELARREHGRELLLIALTGYGADTDKHRAIAAGFDRHLTKPADPDALAQAIQSARRPPGSSAARRA